MKMEFSIISVTLNKLFVLLSTFILIKYILPPTRGELEGGYLESGLLFIIAIVAI